MKNTEMKINELTDVLGGAKKATAKQMLVCSACGNTLDPAKATITILPGEVTECPRCHQVAMMLNIVNA